MKQHSIAITLISLVALSIGLQTAQARPRWFGRADKNNDGVVTKREAHVDRVQTHERARVNRPWEARADKNNDGHVDKAEFHKYRAKVMDTDGNGKISKDEQRAFWHSWSCKVDSDVERKYDTNKDGILTYNEARVLMEDRLAVIRTDGKAIVNTPLEAEFDANDDGIIDAEEAEELKIALE